MQLIPDKQHSTREICKLTSVGPPILDAQVDLRPSSPIDTVPTSSVSHIMPKADKRAKLAQLAALRKSGKKTFDSYEVEDVQDLYEEVDEDRYKNIVRDRLNQDDFVVDDNGEGYADDGREEWDRVRVYESDSEDDLPVRGKERKICMHSASLYRYAWNTL